MTETGVAPFLLTASLTAQGRGLLLPEAVVFLKRHQQGQGSWLAPFLPAQVVRLLAEEKPERAARLFNGPEPVRCPDLIWQPEHRRVCFARALKAVKAAVEGIAAAPDAWPAPARGAGPVSLEGGEEEEEEEDPYADLSAQPQVWGVYLEEFLAAAGPSAFVRPPASHDLLSQLLSSLARLVKACRPAPQRVLSRTVSSSGEQQQSSTLPYLLNLYPHERGLPPHPLDHALLLLRCIHRCVVLWPPHPQVWESVGVSGIASTLDWALTFPPVAALADDATDANGGGGETTRLRVLGEAVAILLAVILHPATAASASATPSTGRQSPSLPSAASSVSGINQVAARYTAAANQVCVRLDRPPNLSAATNNHRTLIIPFCTFHRTHQIKPHRAPCPAPSASSSTAASPSPTKWRVWPSTACVGPAPAGEGEASPPRPPPPTPW